MQFRQTTLENGLEIVAEINPDAYSLALAFFVKTGSRDETSEIAGVSHFLEHMVFKGTARRSAEDVNRELDEMGSQSNAYTSEEQTVYYTVVLPEMQERAVDLLSDIMRPSLREEDFETEKQVILEEILKYEDQPPFGGHEKCMATYFGDHPLGNSVLGTLETVGALTPQQMMDYFQARYSPQNLTLVATGNVDWEKLIAQANNACGNWQALATSRTMQAAPVNQKFELVHKETASQQYVIQLANAPAADDEDRYAARLLAQIIGDDSGSRLFWELVDPGLAEVAATEAYEYQGAGVFMNYLCCAPEHAEENLAKLSNIIAEVEKHGVTDKELDQAKNKVASHLVLRSESPASRLFAVGSAWIQWGGYRTVVEGVDCYRKVKLNQVHQIIEKYPLSKNTTLTIGPLKNLSVPV